MGNRDFIRYFIIVAMLVVVLLSHHLPNHNNGNHPHPHRHRRLLMLRSNYTNSTGDNQSEKQHHIPPEVTNRIVRLFPEIGKEQTEWFVSLDEITQRILQQAQNEMDLHDKNHDGYVSFSESNRPSWFQDDDDDSYDNSKFLWTEEHFNASDADGDGLLNLTEFIDFLNPAESNNPKLRQWLCKVEIRERDADRDGKVNFEEFLQGLFDLVRSHDEGSRNDSLHSDDSKYASARVMFSQLDKDDDGYLSSTELLPIIEKVHPSLHHLVKQQAEYINSPAEDGRLSVIKIVTKMIKHPDLFYSAIFKNDRDEYDDPHDEVTQKSLASL